jgi:hypothetical protein
MFLKSTVPSLIHFEAHCVIIKSVCSFQCINVHCTQLCGPDGCVGMSTWCTWARQRYGIASLHTAPCSCITYGRLSSQAKIKSHFPADTTSLLRDTTNEHPVSDYKKSFSKQLYVWRKLLSEVNTLEGYHFTSELTSLHTCQLCRILANKATVPPQNTQGTWWIRISHRTVRHWL